MTFALGARSLGFMAGVHPDLLAVIELGITLSSVDFGVTEPQVRTLAEQKRKVAQGVSQTLRSNHIEQRDLSGKTALVYGHAVDLVPWIGGKFVWDWPAIYHVQAAIAQAGHTLGLADKLCWGGNWGAWVGSYAPADATAAHMQAGEMAYVAARRKAGKRAFVDGPHIQAYALG